MLTMSASLLIMSLSKWSGFDITLHKCYGSVWVNGSTRLLELLLE